MRSEARPIIVDDVRQSADLAPVYHLVLLDDDDHSYAYVIAMLAHVFGHSVHKGFALACMVDSTGRAIVETAGHDQVTRHQRQIHAFGADPAISRSRGSMSAIVEQAS